MIITRVTGCVAAAAAALLLAAPVAGASAAARKPVVVSWANASWRRMSARPADFYFGMGGAPFITGLHWRSWGRSKAVGAGTLHVPEAGCYPTDNCPYHRHYLRMVLTDVRKHDGKRYFDHMKVVIKRGHRAVIQHLVFRKEDGGTEPFWWGPDAWPYL